ncbi:FAD-binding oxidoreductase [Anaeropeptidivorans aminofermentans]|uniref:FAD-binding oxidoreductase n=1 Tax=Anaeropeptidivorans aminofermentans TaxID=2934315 RepID=UPI0020258A95|nr:FAD-binding oxidoreductase [Anaeropeptidivorans aminofermentans]
MEKLILKLGDEFSDYLRDESRNVGVAGSISFPENIEQLEKIIKVCSENNWSVTVQCARTGISGGACPNSEHIINLSKMNKVINYENKGSKTTVTVEPGLALTELRKYIDENINTKLENKVFFPTDPTEATAGIGGIVACNASGAKSYLYGSVRQYVESLKIILSDGRKIHIKRGEVFANGRQFKIKAEDGSFIEGFLPGYHMPEVKNAAGYYAADNMDMIELFIGSDGTLGIIYEIELGLIGQPEYTWGITAFFDSEKDSLKFVNELKLSSGVNPAAIEFFNERAIDILRKQRQINPAFAKIRPIEDSYNTAIYIELHGNSYDEMVQRVLNCGDILEKSGGKKEQSWFASNANDLDNLLFFRHGIPECVNMFIDERKKKDSQITKLGTDIAVPDGVFGHFVDSYNNDLKNADLEYAIWGHIGNNHLHVNILPNNGEEYKKGKTLHEKWAKAAGENGGTVSAEHGVGKTKAPYLKYMYGEESYNEMRLLKAAFDLGYMFNQGNMFNRGDR